MRHLTFFVCLCLNLPACQTQPKSTLSQDGHPAFHHIPKNLHLIPDAKPRQLPFSRYGNPKQYTVFNKSYRVLNSQKGYKEIGGASWYGTKFHGRRTSSGEPYDMFAMTAAHKSLPIPCFAKIINLDNGKTVLVKINDRGPFHSNRIIDLSYSAAAKLGILKNGIGRVQVEAIDRFDSKISHIIDDMNIANQAGLGTEKYKAEVKKQTENLMNRAQHKSKIGKYYLQLGAFSDKAKAKALISKVKPYVQKPLNIIFFPKENLFKVRLGPFSNRLNALAYTEKLTYKDAPLALLVN